MMRISPENSPSIFSANPGFAQRAHDFDQFRTQVLDEFSKQSTNLKADLIHVERTFGQNSLVKPSFEYSSNFRRLFYNLSEWFSYFELAMQRGAYSSIRIIWMRDGDPIFEKIFSLDTHRTPLAPLQSNRL